MAKHDKLNSARINKSDEFYTRIEDIESELYHYKNHFRDKVVFCNCDDPYESNFFKYFALNFNHLGLKKLITTCYNGCDEIPLFDDGSGVMRKAVKAVIVIDELYDINRDGAVDEEDVKLMLKKPGVVTELKGNGDFDSPECIELLKQSDIVCTNPPFSEFREFIKTMMNYDKKFLVIGNMNALTYKSIFTLIKENKMWVGYNFNKSLIFQTPYENEVESNRRVVKSKGFDPDSHIMVSGVCWFTNLEHTKRYESLILYRRYRGNESSYPKYDNYDAINVSKVADIPDDYDGVMGVPITFIGSYCPDQFEMLGMSASAGYDKKIVGIDFDGDVDARPIVKGKTQYARILIKRK